MGYYDNPPYYLTAYGIAVKHGYQGTEEEWIHEIQESAHYSSIAAAASAEAAAGSATAAGNAKTAAEVARDLAAEWAAGEDAGVPGEENNAAYFAGQASDSADSAAASEAAAAASAETARGYAEDTGGLVTDTVLGYLEETITNPDSPPLDRALTSAVSAAPADLVGDLESAFKALELYGGRTIVCGESDADTYLGVTVSRTGASYSISGTATNGSTTAYPRFLLSSPNGITYAGNTSGVNSFTKDIPLRGGNIYRVLSAFSGTVTGSGSSKSLIVKNSANTTLATIVLGSDTPYADFEISEDTTVNVFLSISLGNSITGNLQIAILDISDQKIIYDYNSIDAFALYPSATRTTAGITFTKNNNGSWTVSGMATGAAFCNLLGLSNKLPAYIVPGRSYYLDLHEGGIPVRVYFYDSNGDVIGGTSTLYGNNASITVPTNAAGVIMRMEVAEGLTISETVFITLITEPAHGGGSGGGDVYNITNNYDITTSPVITTDAHGWLLAVDTDTGSDETEKTDMSGAILSMLTDTGYCHLSPGIFYVSGNITMPEGSVIEGCGYGTVVRLLQSAGASTVFNMRSGCRVSDLAIEGNYTDIARSSTIGGRNGIGWTDSDNQYGVVTRCKISRFDGAGILLQDTTQYIDHGMNISDCTITDCNVGIYIRKNSEFNKIVNCTIVRCYYGYYNRGGNNNMANCGIDANVVGIQIDDNEGTNGGHGTITGCCINHSNSNTGYGLIISGTGRMMVSNCNIYFSKILLENTDGNVISNCGFGKNAGWEISGGECSVFIGCMIRSAADSPITVLNNTAAKVIECFDRAGNEVSLFAEA